MNNKLKNQLDVENFSEFLGWNPIPIANKLNERKEKLLISVNYQR